MISHSTPFQISSTKGQALGTSYTGPDVDGSRVWKYCLAGAGTLARGKLNVESDTVGANHSNLSFTVAPAIGDRVVKVTLGGAAVTANQYKDGYLVVQDGTGEGRAYPIEGHNVQATTTGTLSVDLKETIDTAGAVSEANVDLIKNRYAGVVVSNPDQADVPVGVNNVSITATYYGWVQTWGPCAVLQDEAVAIGDTLTIGSSVSGSIEAQDAAGEPLVGIQGPNTGVDAEYQLVYLRLEQ